MWKRVGLVLVIAACGAPRGPAAPAPAPAAGYDAALAERLGADERGMRAYVIALLKEGPNRDQSEEEAGRLMKAHLANIVRLADEGTLVVAGPFLDDGPLRGLYVFKVATIEEARALTESDPAIQAGRLVMELHPWYGSAAMLELTAIHKRIQKTSLLDAE